MKMVFLCEDLLVTGQIVVVKVFTAISGELEGGYIEFKNNLKLSDSPKTVQMIAGHMDHSDVQAFTYGDYVID